MRKEISSSAKRRSNPTMTRSAESLSTLLTLAFKDSSRFSLLNHLNSASCFDKLWRLSSESKFDSLNTTSQTSREEQRSLRKSIHIGSNLLIVHSSTEQRWSLSTTVICECQSMQKTCLSTSNIALMLHSKWGNSFMTRTSTLQRNSSPLREQPKIIERRTQRESFKLNCKADSSLH